MYQGPRIPPPYFFFCQFSLITSTALFRNRIKEGPNSHKKTMNKSGFNKSGCGKQCLPVNYYKQWSFHFFVRSKCASKGVAQGIVAWRNFSSSYCDSVTHWDCFSSHCYEVRVHWLVNLKKSWLNLLACCYIINFHCNIMVKTFFNLYIFCW
jgi:hypothetical protein